MIRDVLVSGIVRMLHGLGTVAGKGVRLLPFSLRAYTARRLARAAHQVPYRLYPVLYPFANAFVRQLFFGRQELVPIIHSVAPQVTMELNIAEKGPRLIALGRPYEKPITLFLRRFLLPGMTFVDVGAHRGYHTLCAAAAVGAEGRVIAFEAEPRNYDALCKNIARNHYVPRVVAVPAAISDMPGHMTLHLNPLNDGGASLTPHEGYHDSATVLTEEYVARQFIGAPLAVEVPVTSLDAYVQAHQELQNRKIDCIKIDIEGHEYPALKGMHAVLRTSRPHIICEVGKWSTALVTLLSEERYAVHTISHRGELVPVPAAVELPHGNYALTPSET